MSTNAERLKDYKEKMKKAGFRRLYCWVHPDLLVELERQRHCHECGGRTLERILLGESRSRPAYWIEEEFMKRRAKHTKSLA